MCVYMYKYRSFTVTRFELILTQHGSSQVQINSYTREAPVEHVLRDLSVCLLHGNALSYVYNPIMTIAEK